MFYFKDDKGITIYFNDGKIATWSSTDDVYNDVVKKAENSDWIMIKVMYNPTEAIMNTSNKVTIEKDKIKCNDVEIDINNNVLTKLIAVCKEAGIIDTEIESIKPFLQNCIDNPYINAPKELYDYCKALDFEITDDGCFLAYKKVRNDFTSIYDGKTLHNIGSKVSVENFDNNRSEVCSTGLHFCSKSYLPQFGSSDPNSSKVIVVKVNPKDVIAIPTDYNFAKGRCKEYEVIAEMSHSGTLKTTNTKEKVVKTATKKAIDKAIRKKTDRVQETADYMRIHNNNKATVSNIMGISIATVERNMRRFKHR